MPAIEIACIGLAAPVHIDAGTFAVAYEPGLKSQRVPSRFQEDFDRLSGCLYRIGKPKGRAPLQGGGLAAYELLSANSRGPLTMREFWSLHESRALYLNTAYALLP